MNVRRIVALLLLVACGAAVWMLNRHGAAGEINPSPLLYLVADTQRELERIPMELTRVSDEKENEIGTELARSEGLEDVVVSGSTAENRRIEQYLNAVGKDLTASVKRPAINYRFHYIPQDYFVNAAAMPGGQIVFGRGLLRLLDTEDELAAILGHEIAHVDERHAIERLQYEMKARQLGLGGIYDLGAPAIQLFEAGYTKEQEADADRIGLEFAVGAGYSSGGALDAMRKLRELEPNPGAQAGSPVEELAGVPIQALEEYFRSHPPATERIAAFEKQIAEHNWDSNRPQRPLAIRTIFRTEEAEKLDRAGEFQKAIARYRDAIRDDPSYGPPRHGLVRALWRSGDAAGTITAAEDALPIDNRETKTSHLLAMALAANSCSTAPETFQQQRSKFLSGAAFAGVAATIDANGLAILCNIHADQGIENYRNTVETINAVRLQAEVRLQMAGWMYRAGRLDEALKEIETAFQQSPATFDNPLRAWVLSDLGRQADAQAALYGIYVGDGEAQAASAVIHWRTEQRDLAKQEFQQAAKSDPVWMEPHWAKNNYSAKAASVISELRDAEISRRKEEEDARKRHAATTGGSNPQ